MAAKTKSGKDSQEEDAAVVPRGKKGPVKASSQWTEGLEGRGRRRRERGEKTGVGQKNTKTKRAGITFPMAKVISRMKKQKVGKRISVGAGVYAAAVMEYLAAEFLELAGNAAKDKKKKRIIGGHIHLAVRHDHELNALLGVMRPTLGPFTHSP